MRITRIAIEGLRGAPAHPVDLDGSLVRLPAGAAGVALLDAVALVRASLDRRHAPDLLRALGVVGAAVPVAPIDAVQLDEDEAPSDPVPDAPIQVYGAPRSSLLTGLSLAEADPGRLHEPLREDPIVVTLGLDLDPPLFGLLREHALRDPRLAQGLSEASLSLRVAWKPVPGPRVHYDVALTRLGVGETAFPTVGAEAPAWLGTVARAVADRLCRVGLTPLDAVLHDLHLMVLSPDPARRARARRIARAFADSPFHFGELGFVAHPARSDGVVPVRPVFGPELLRPEALGRAGAEALQLVHAAMAADVDVLLVDRPGALQEDPRAVLEWLEGLTRGADATLEQVLFTGGAP